MSGYYSDEKCTVCRTNSVDFKITCGHKFCHFCILRMERGNNTECPLCKKLWVVGSAQPKNEYYHLLKMDSFDPEIVCLEHKRLYHDWCKSCESLSCTKCSLFLHKSHLVEPVEDSALDMKKNIEKKLELKKNQYWEEIDDLKNTEKDMLKLKNQLEQLLLDVEKDISSAKRAREERENCMEMFDIMQSFLEKEAAVNYACVYSRSAGLLSDLPVGGLPEVNSMKLLLDLMKEHPKFEILIKDIWSKVAEFKLAKKNWYIDDTSSVVAAVIASETIPDYLLNIVYNHDERSLLPLEFIAQLLANGTKNATVGLYSNISFHNEIDYDQNYDGLFSLCLKNKCTLISYFGQCPTDLKSLPQTVEWLGLCFRNEEEATKLSNLNLWQNLKFLAVSLPYDLQNSSLRPLPEFNYALELHITGNIDNFVHVRTVIDKLTTGILYSSFGLYFPHYSPSSKLSGDIKDLNLKGLRVDYIHFNSKTVSEEMQQVIREWLKKNYYNILIKSPVSVFDDCLPFEVTN